MDVELEIDTEKLSILLSSMQHTEPADLLKTILGDRLNLPSARGATLLISVSNTGQLVTTNVTELLKASDGELAMLLSSLTQEQAKAASGFDLWKFDLALDNKSQNKFAIGGSFLLGENRIPFSAVGVKILNKKNEVVKTKHPTIIKV